MSTAAVCCVCGQPVESPEAMLGGRAYCANHLAALNRPHAGFWRAGLIQIVGMGLFSAIIASVGGMVGELERLPLIIVGLLLAIVPTGLWLAFFYQQDRLEPEPKTRIAAVFLLALLVAEALGRRIVDDWFQIGRWAASNNLTSLAASILIAGFVYQGIAYLAVRVVVYNTPEFDERMDGIVYGTVAGLGIATLLNLRYILDNNGVSLAPGVIHVATVALAQASFGGLMGYFMAQAKFEHKPVFWVPLGVVVAAVLNGLFNWLLNEVSASGVGVEPWRSLVLGLIMALVVFFVLVALMRRTTAVTLAPPVQERQ